eukprot:scaffold81605_cov28-Tisochrysis_lutea.AAC.2
MSSSPIESVVPGSSGSEPSGCGGIELINCSGGSVARAGAGGAAGERVAAREGAPLREAELTLVLPAAVAAELGALRPDSVVEDLARFAGGPGAGSTSAGARAECATATDTPLISAVLVVALRRWFSAGPTSLLAERSRFTTESPLPLALPVGTSAGAADAPRLGAAPRVRDGLPSESFA